MRADDTPNIAVFADYENIALGAEDARIKFDINLVLARLLDRGNVVVRKAYSDWERYKKDRKPLHEASFELIEIPHVSFSGKNSADIRMVVDALDLCHTKPHVGVFALLTGDSDFSPLVSKLRENNKIVLGVGVKNSTSDLLVSICDEFVYYDDLALEAKPKRAKKPRKENGTNAKLASATAAEGRDDGLELIIETAERMLRDTAGTLWASMIKQAIIRNQPTFSESNYGFRSFNRMIEAAADEGLLVIKKDDKGGGYSILDMGPEA